MNIETSKVVEALTKVTDPKSGQDIITMSMVRDLEVKGNDVNFSIELPTMEIKHKSDLNFACIQAVQEIYPEANVNVHMISRTGNAQEPASPLSHVKNIIAVASGKGGVGKSTVSVNLALGLKKLGAKVGLIDADLYGPSIPTMLGLQGHRPKVQEVYGEPKIIPLEAFGMPVMSIGFIIEPEQAVVLRGPRLGGIIKQFFEDTIWPELDFLIVDLPPGTGDIQLTLVQTVPVTGAIMVTTPQEVAVADALKAMNMFLMPSVNVPILGIVENMSWFTPEELPDNKYFLFGQGGGEKLAKLGHAQLLGQVPIVQRIRESGDEGAPIVLKDVPFATEAFMKVAENTLKQVAARNEKMGPTNIVKINT
ncbi:MAG: Mrp/NBP35 family ATP-binding protein [Lewinellaceae bacterium]|nr:Mrp/NBP35 family ATP-binding protein [Phaeodactylibacter sp.]MCB0612234.1 Mrp/NBP35 family ATP-binding protein [Phaeodactylibacter sp.]MCB9351820.1 Mrp/NBP35 family ATP-binding protein [Lewinellaceae bacterium]